MRHLGLLALLVGCTGGPGEFAIPAGEEPAAIPDPGPPDTCDAGAESWVARTIPLMWGRRAHSYAEVQMWAAMAAEHGRGTVTRAMAEDPEFVQWWATWFTDSLGVARSGDKSYASCFEEPMLAGHDGSLAEFIAANGPEDAAFDAPFNMADVLRSALVADDLSVAYRVHLFARMNKPVQGANVDAYELEYNRRVSFGEMFYETYLNRSLTCLPCHNSEYSVTGSTDPTLDRTWEIPGHFESALLGVATGIPEDEAFAMFRYSDLMEGQRARAKPWGMDPDCGRFARESGLTTDILEQEGYFIVPQGESGSVWMLESYLAQGVRGLVSDGLDRTEDDVVSGPEAFAWLVAMNIADQVWAEAVGSPLTTAFDFPRNRHQRDKLRRFSDTFVRGGFSLRDLLVQITTDEYFNPGLPVTCPSQAYGMDPVFDPWTPEEPDEDRKKNGPGDSVHRLSARTMLQSVHETMGWDPPEQFGLSSGDRDLQAAIGVYIRESQPGFNGVDFQGLLAFEEAYGTCSFGNGDEPDTLDRIMEAGLQANASVGDAARSVKDRLLQRSGIDDAERPFMEALLEASLDVPLEADHEEGLRMVCGALLMSPQWSMVTDPGELGPIPPLSLGGDEDCLDLSIAMRLQGVEVACADHIPSTSGTTTTDPDPARRGSRGP